MLRFWGQVLWSGRLIKNMLNIFSKKRRCLFCGSTKLSKEHIYPQWLFKTLKLETLTFKPSNHLHVSEVTELGESPLFHKNTSDNREIRYDDFTVKSVCGICNNGWMSDIESKVEQIITNILCKTKSIQLSSEEALIVSKWTVLKSILLAQAVQTKIYLHETILKQLKDGIIPEGFIIEISDLTTNALNFATGNVSPPIAINISRQEFDIVVDNYFLVSFQIGEIGFRVSHFRTALPIFRAQLVKRLCVLYPYKSLLPFMDKIDIVLEDELGKELKIVDFKGVEELRNTLVLYG